MRRSDWLVGQLPMGMLDDDFFVRFASLFQELATSLLEDVDNVGNVVDLSVAPPAFVRWLGSWIGIATIDSSLPVALQRRIVRESSQILAWRGTRRGLEQFLELVCGAPAEVEDSGGIFPEGEGGDRAPFVTIRVSSTGWVDEEDFVALIADELPANVSYSVHVGDRQLWPPPDGEDLLLAELGGQTARPPQPPTGPGAWAPTFWGPETPDGEEDQPL
jgi:phage tail-like protein